MTRPNRKISGLREYTLQTNFWYVPKGLVLEFKFEDLHRIPRQDRVMVHRVSFGIFGWGPRGVFGTGNRRTV